MKNTLATLWRTFGGYRWHVVALAVFGIISALLEGIGINAVIPLMSFFSSGGGEATDFISRNIQGMFGFFSIPFKFNYLLAFIFALFLLRAVSVVAFGYVRGWISSDFLGKESSDVLHRALLVSWPFSLRQKLGTMHNMLVRDIQQTGALLDGVSQIIQSFTGFSMYFLVAINISPTMTLYALGGGAILMLLSRPFLRRAQHIGEQTAGIEKQFAQFLSEHIIGMKAVKAAGVERAAIADGDEHIQILRSLSIRRSLVNSLSTSLFQPVSIVLVVLLFLLTYHLPTFNIISFATSLYLIQKIFTYLESGQAGLQSVSMLAPYAKNIAAFKHDLDMHRESSVGGNPFIFTKELDFKDIFFAYDGGKPILNGVSFAVRAGETVGLVGPSGAGKTSIADLLLRLFRPSAGSLWLDGVKSDSIALKEWRTHVGYVPQDIFLLNSTIEENIRFYNRSLTMEDVENAARRANIHEFIASLPEGFKTVTGDRGVMLSGGQRQRIALARALAGNPDILILDEATSALDHESEKLIHESIRALHGKMTVLIIAHRPSTVAEADTILVLDRGRVAERGTPRELLEDCSTYFYKMQTA